MCFAIISVQIYISNIDWLIQEIILSMKKQSECLSTDKLREYTHTTYHSALKKKVWTMWPTQEPWGRQANGNKEAEHTLFCQVTHTGVQRGPIHRTGVRGGERGSINEPTAFQSEQWITSTEPFYKNPKPVTTPGRRHTTGVADFMPSVITTKENIKEEKMIERRDLEEPLHWF